MAELDHTGGFDEALEKIRALKRVAERAQIRTVPGIDVRNWRPAGSAQQAFVSTDAKEALFAGPVGSGKTEALLVSAVRALPPGGHGVVFRRSIYEVQAALVRAARHLLPRFDYESSSGGLTWNGPDGRRLTLSPLSISGVGDAVSHVSREYAFVGFDELDTFDAIEYRKLLARLRQKPGRMRSTIALGCDTWPPEWIRARFADIASWHRRGVGPMPSVSTLDSSPDDQE